MVSSSSLSLWITYFCTNNAFIHGVHPYIILVFFFQLLESLLSHLSTLLEGILKSVHLISNLFNQLISIVIILPYLCHNVFLFKFHFVIFFLLFLSKVLVTSTNCPCFFAIQHTSISLTNKLSLCLCSFLYPVHTQWTFRSPCTRHRGKTNISIITLHLVHIDSIYMVTEMHRHDFLDLSCS